MNLKGDSGKHQSSLKRGKDIVSGLTKTSKKLGLPEPQNWHLPKHNYTGPFTNLDERLDENEKPKPGFEPYNQIDNIAMHHDICYKHADEKLYNLTRKACDKEMLNELDDAKTKGIREKIDYMLVKPVIWLKYKLGLGIEDTGYLLAEELHKPIRSKFKRRRVMVYNIDDIWSADLHNTFQSLAKQNKHYKYMLNVIDLFSKYAYSIPLKTKSSDEITEAFSKLFKFSGRKPTKLWTDQGGEFINNKFKQFLKEHDIDLYHVFNEGKACVVERFNRTLGEMIQKHMTANKTDKYVDILQKLLDEYNNRTHSAIKMSPHDASKFENHDEVFKALISKVKGSKKKPVFKVGDRVRLYAKKGLFDKGYKPNWTTEIFVVNKVNKTDPVTYNIKDLQGEDIIGKIYEQELQRTSF